MILYECSEKFDITKIKLLICGCQNFHYHIIWNKYHLPLVQDDHQYDFLLVETWIYLIHIDGYHSKALTSLILSESYLASSSSSVRWMASVSYFVLHWETSLLALESERWSSPLASCSSSNCSLRRSQSWRADWSAWARAFLALKVKGHFINVRQTVFYYRIKNSYYERIMTSM